MQEIVLNQELNYYTGWKCSEIQLALLTMFLNVTFTFNPFAKYTGPATAPL